MFKINVVCGIPTISFITRIDKEDTEPRYVINEKADFYEIIVELPGVKKEDIELYSSENSIYLSAKRIVGFQKEYKLRINLESKIEDVKAKYENGLLEIIARKKGFTKIKID